MGGAAAFAAEPAPMILAVPATVEETLMTSECGIRWS
jgi:hypothetical protein